MFADIDNCDEKKEILEEIIMNLEEKVADLKAEGKSEEDAVNKAIVDFGDMDEIKKIIDTSGDHQAHVVHDLVDRGVVHVKGWRKRQERREHERRAHELERRRQAEGA